MAEYTDNEIGMIFVSFDDRVRRTMLSQFLI